MLLSDVCGQTSVRTLPACYYAAARRRRAYQSMKIALKYGIVVTLIIAAWIALKHFVLHFEGDSAQLADVTIFNLTAIVALGMGIRERRMANGDRLSFLQGLGTGVSIAITYA